MIKMFNNFSNQFFYIEIAAILQHKFFVVLKVDKTLAKKVYTIFVQILTLVPELFDQRPFSTDLFSTLCNRTNMDLR